jgi:hypothetical protein
MPKSSIKWPIAKTPNGEYIRIDQAKASNFYRCPQCSARFVARQGNMKTWHFAHYPGTVCSGEGARHEITKHIVAASLGKIKQLPLYCFCYLPTKPYVVEFTDVKVEDTVQEYRVDVTCRLKGKLLCLEIVDSNPVIDDKRLAFQDKLVEIDIAGLTDKEVFLGDKIQSLLEAGLSRFLSRIAPKHMFIHSWYGSCWKCGERRRVAIVCDNGDESMQWQQSFPPEILSTLKKYTELDFRRTSIVREGYIANICPHCRSTQGDFPLHDELIELLADGKDSEIETIFVALE